MKQFFLLLQFLQKEGIIIVIFITGVQKYYALLINNGMYIPLETF